MAQNKWLQHVARFRQNNKTLSATDVMKKARASYQRGGGGNDTANVTTNGNGSPVSPYAQKGLASGAFLLKGGGVESYYQTKTESTPAEVTKGGRRSRRQSRRRSRRTRRR